MDKQKHCVRFFEILLVWFLKYLKKGIRKKIGLGFLRFCKYALFKSLKKLISKKIVFDFLRFCRYVFFKYLKISYEEKNCARLFKTL